MSFLDDDELPDPSNPEYHTRADHGKKDRLERKAAHKGKLSSFKRALLRHQTDPQKAADMAKKEEYEQKPQQRDDDQPLMMGTKTQKQLEKQQVQDAQTDDTAETLLQKDEQQQAVKDESDEEYQQNMT